MRTRVLQRQRQRMAEPAAPAVAPPVTQALEQTLAQSPSGQGQALPSGARDQIQTALPHDFSSVRIHDDENADRMARGLNARAFTTGNHIFFRQGAYQPQTQPGMRLLAHEATHTVQQAQATPAAPGAAVQVDDAGSASEREAEAVAQQVTGEAPAEAGAVAVTGARSGVVQRAPDTPGATPTSAPAPTGTPQTGTPTTAPPQNTTTAPGGVSRNEVDLIGLRLRSRQVALASFLATARTDIGNIRNYFKWVNSVYDRCYGHYDLILKQAKLQADSAQAWMDLVSGVATGVAVGLFVEAFLPLSVAARTVQYLGEVGAEAAEGVIAGFIGKATKADADPFAAPIELHPAFKQLASLQQLDKLTSTLLAMSVPGSYVYSEPIAQVERLSGELRVAEAGGARKMDDSEVRRVYLKLMEFDVASIPLEQQLLEVEAKFTLLRAAYNGKQAPTDQRCEQDIWIPWIAKQSETGVGFWSLGPTLNMDILRNHFDDIGLSTRGGRGGRLNADTDTSRSHTQYGPQGVTSIGTASQLVQGAKAAQEGLKAYWADVFLMGSGAPAGGKQGG